MRYFLNIPLAILAIEFWLLPVDFADAHHVLGRPTYSLNEDSNTPPSMQAEVQIGNYMVTYMVFPAFPRPEQPGRVNLYASRIDDGAPYQGKVTFRVRDDSWLSWFGMSGKSERLGAQLPDDHVFRQGYVFHEAGDYIISAEFRVGEVPYVIDFPLRIGEPPLVGPIGIIVLVLMVTLVGVSMMQHRRSVSGKIRGANEHRASG